MNLESLPPEVITSILLQLSFTDILPICRTSSYLQSFCQDWNFWSDKAFRDFEFPRNLFRSAAVNSPIQRYRQIQDFFDTPNSFIIDAAKDNDLELVKYLIHVGATEFDYPIIEAATYGNLVMVRDLISAWRSLPPPVMFNEAEFTQSLNEALLNAVKANHHSSVQKLIQNGATDLDGALYEASNTGNLDLVKYLVDAGATDLDSALVFAVSKNHPDIVRYLLTIGVNPNNGLSRAAMAGNMMILRELIHAGATNLNNALLDATWYNQVDAVKELIQNGANDLNDALSMASRNGNLDIVNYLLQAGANNLDSALLKALEYKHYNVVNRLRQAGAIGPMRQLIPSPYYTPINIVQTIGRIRRNKDHPDSSS